jgi:hypothetical protein
MTTVETFTEVAAPATSTVPLNADDLALQGTCGLLPCSGEVPARQTGQTESLEDWNSGAVISL